MLKMDKSERNRDTPVRFRTSVKKKSKDIKVRRVNPAWVFKQAGRFRKTTYHYPVSKSHKRYFPEIRGRVEVKNWMCKTMPVIGHSSHTKQLHGAGGETLHVLFIPDQVFR